MARPADTGARPRIERDPARPGWSCITVDRAKGTRRLWLADDELALLRVEIDRALPPVTVTRQARAGRVA